MFSTLCDRENKIPPINVERSSWHVPCLLESGNFPGWFTAKCMKGMCYCYLMIQLFRERLSEKKIKVYATRPKGGLGIHWDFAYWPKGNLQVCFFACTWKICFSSQGSVSVALLLLSHVFE